MPSPGACVSLCDLYKGCAVWPTAKVGSRCPAPWCRPACTVFPHWTNHRPPFNQTDHVTLDLALYCRLLEWCCWESGPDGTGVGLVCLSHPSLWVFGRDLTNTQENVHRDAHTLAAAHRHLVCVTVVTAQRCHWLSHSSTSILYWFRVSRCALILFQITIWFR